MIPQTDPTQVTARVPKLVDCENCRQRYVYLMERTGFASLGNVIFLYGDVAQHQAYESAKVDLQFRLERNCDPVPCPRCGWYQARMLKKAKAQQWKGLHIAGALALIIAVPAALVAFVAQGIRERNPSNEITAVVQAAVAISVAGAGLGAVLLGVRFRLMARYDPNRELAAVRIDEGRDRAWTLDEYAVILARQPVAGDRAGGTSDRPPPA